MRAQSKSRHPSSIDLNSGKSSRRPRSRLVAKRKKRKERRKQPRILAGVRNATKEHRRFLDFSENTYNLSKGKRDHLNRLMVELIDLNDDPFPPEPLSKGRMTLFLTGGGPGRVFPRTDLWTLGNKLIASKNWPKVMANEFLLYWEVAHRRCFPEAAPDVLKWCAKYGLQAPDSALSHLRSNALPRENTQGQGQRPLDSKWRQRLKDFVRVIASIESVRAIAAERKAPGYHRPDVDMANDRYWRAKRLLAGPWKYLGADTRGDSTAGIRKSLDNFKKRKCPLYLDTRRQMNIFRVEAPILYKLLD